MSAVHDVTVFDPDYDLVNVAKIVRAIKSQTSLLVIGMPGCGKSRLIDFLLHRPGVLEKHGLADGTRFVRIDGDTLTASPQEIYIRFLRALNPQIKARPAGGLDIMKDYLIAEVESLDPDIDLIVIFDNFRHSLQQALGEEFFNFLFGLRNARLKLNLNYIFMANLRIDLNGFYKLERSLDRGADHSICWLTLLNERDTSFSIERQWQKITEQLGHINTNNAEAIKKRIFQLSGGHALLTKFLSHLFLSGEIAPDTSPAELLNQSSIRTACLAIWNDLAVPLKNVLVDLTMGNQPPTSLNNIKKILRNYGILTEQDRFFSPIFENFVRSQEKTGEVLNVNCDHTNSNLIIRTIDQTEVQFSLVKLTPRQRTLLCYLAANLDEICTKDQLKDMGWPKDDSTWVSDQALSRQVEEIRKWLKDQRELSQYLQLETEWGTGYKLKTQG